MNYTYGNHTDDRAVTMFAEMMRNKMAASRNKGRGGWDDPAACSTGALAKMLIEHLMKGNDGTFVDVANFAMMLHLRGADPTIMVHHFPSHIMVAPMIPDHSY